MRCAAVNSWRRPVFGHPTYRSGSEFTDGLLRVCYPHSVASSRCGLQTLSHSTRAISIERAPVVALELHTARHAVLAEEAVDISVIRSWVGALLIAAGLPAAGRGEPIVARVSPVVAFAPRDVLVDAFIEPDVRNRSVEVVVESAGFYTSSTAELDGDRAPRLKQVWFRQLPAGKYQVRITVMGTDGKRGYKVLIFELVGRVAWREPERGRTRGSQRGKGAYAEDRVWPLCDGAPDRAVSLS